MLNLGNTGGLQLGSRVDIGRQVEANLAVLLIDRSTSMRGQKSSYASAGAWDFSRAALMIGQKVGVINFASHARIVCMPTLSAEAIRASCLEKEPYGSTAMHEALESSLSLTPRKGDLIVVVTDGCVDEPWQALALGAKLKARGIRIVAIGTDDADQQFLKRLASSIDLGIKVRPHQLQCAISDAAKLLTAP